MKPVCLTSPQFGYIGTESTEWHRKRSLREWSLEMRPRSAESKSVTLAPWVPSLIDVVQQADASVECWLTDCHFVCTSDLVWHKASKVQQTGTIGCPSQLNCHSAHVSRKIPQIPSWLVKCCETAHFSSTVYTAHRWHFHPCRALFGDQETKISSRHSFSLTKLGKRRIYQHTKAELTWLMAAKQALTEINLD